MKHRIIKYLLEKRSYDITNDAYIDNTDFPIINYIDKIKDALIIMHSTILEYHLEYTNLLYLPSNCVHIILDIQSHDEEDTIYGIHASIYLGDHIRFDLLYANDEMRHELFFWKDGDFDSTNIYECINKFISKNKVKKILNKIILDAHNGLDFTYVKINSS